ncbi:MAG: autotransporter-associated beta strand repeat-containing protein [Thermoguttaceae bacterium]
MDSYNLAVGSMEGAAPINLSTQILTVGTDNTDSVYTGQISGSGGLIKTGRGTLTLSGNNSYLGLTTLSAGELDLVGANAWNPIMNLGGAYLSGGELIFDYAGRADPYAGILGLLGTKINGSMPVSVLDDTVNDRITILLTVPEPSILLLVASGRLILLAYSWRRKHGV